MRQLVQRFVSVAAVAVVVTAWLAGALALGLATGSGATATVTLMMLGLLAGGVLLLIRHSLDLAARIGNLGTESQRSLAYHAADRIPPRDGAEADVPPGGGDPEPQRHGPDQRRAARHPGLGRVA